ncbi:MAG: hypothetical protein K6F61_08745 [Clostridiales bacterium]|nr:hypothetical protein [Clostridiales bacterium]
MKSQLLGIWFHIQEWGLYPTVKWLCRKTGEQIRKTGYEKYSNWPEYFADQRKKRTGSCQQTDEDWTEFICPFHRGDTITGLLCADAAARQGKHIRMYVADGLKDWLSDIVTDPNLVLVELKTGQPTALETQPGYNRALEESIQRPEVSGRIVSYRPIGRLEDEGTDLVEYILGQLKLPADMKLPNLSVSESRNPDALDGKTGDKPFLLLHPHAGWRIKSLSPGTIESIVTTAHQTGLSVIQIGGEKDKPVNGADGYILENLPLSDWAYLFKKAAAVAGADSWTAHFASMLDVNQVLIYGATEDKTVGLKHHMEKQDSRRLVFESACELQPCTKLYCRKGTRYCSNMNINRETLKEFLLYAKS